MTYDRSGRKVARAADETDSPAAGAATGAGSGDAVRRPAASAGRAGTRPATPGARRPRRAGPVLRVLPVVMLIAGVALSVKAMALWSAFSNGEITVAAFTHAEAEERPAGPEPASVSAEDAAPVQLAQSPQAGEGKEKPIDPVLFTRSEIELLQELSKRRKELDAREQAVIQKEGLLTAAEDRIEKKIQELQSVKSEIEALIKTYDEQEEKQLNDLVSIYERMKPKDAAAIFDELDMEVLLQVFERMKSSKSAPILAQMRPQRAKEITSRIAERRTFPAIN